MPLLPRHRVEAAAFRARSAGRFAVHPLRVSELTRLTEEAVAITLAVPAELRETYRHRAGQHVVALHEHRDEVVRRTYSICSAESDDELRIGVKRIPGGAFSTFATEQLGAGDVLHVTTPTGHFGPSFDPKRGVHYGLVAAGSGITPLLSVAATALELEPRSRVTLLYGNRTRHSVMFRDELESVQRRYASRFGVRYAFSREECADAAQLQGRIGRATLEFVFRAEEVDEWYLCGPEGLMDATADALAHWDVDPDLVHRELFHVGASDVVVDTESRPDLTSEVRLRLNGVETAFSLSARGDPILTAALATRDDLPYACRDGICATCRARVIEGEVEMDRCSALDRRERKAGYVLTCQAHPVTPTVVADFDQ